MKKLKELFLEEYVYGYKPFDYIFMAILIIMQVIAFIIYPDSPISIVAGILGTIATVLCAKGKISYLAYGFIQTFLFIIIDYQAKLYIDTAEQVFYLITMVYAIFSWKKRLKKTDEGSQEIEAKSLSLKAWILIIIAITILTIGVGLIGVAIGSEQAFTDAFSNILAIFGQILCVLCYKEQWILWIILDIADIKMYAFAGNPVLAVMYVGWTINCIYGWYNWTKSIKNNKKKIKK